MTASPLEIPLFAEKNANPPVLSSQLVRSFFSHLPSRQRKGCLPFNGYISPMNLL
jgi:hypothetical protein